MTGLVFVDSNVLIYAVDTRDSAKQRAAQAWRDGLWQQRRGRISFQVLQEFYANVSRKFPWAREEARVDARDLLAWNPVAIDRRILQRAWDIEDKYRLSLWDARIVAAAQSASCRYLLTEDLQAEQDFDGLVVVNPFLREFASLDE